MLSGIIFILLINNIHAGTCEQNSFQEAGPIVETTKGTIIGKYETVLQTKVATFLGVPFAKPPLKEKRFQPPEPADPWTGIKLTREKPNTCPQFSTKDVTSFPWIPSPTLTRSEDCLFLNVWSPAKCSHNPSEKLPVLVWVLPGGFSAGSSSMDLYNGSVLAAFGDVVVVTFNYRTGIFGFLYDGTSVAPGNAGFKDQILALEWVKENIASFRGDPDKVTIFGESAGSISISLHLISPISKNLFNKAIMMSGTAYQPLLIDSPDVALFKLNTFAGAIGCTNKTDSTDASQISQCLKSKDQLELTQVEGAFLLQFPTFFSPVYGSEDFPKAPIDAFNDREIDQVEIIIGDVKDESTIFLSYILPDIFPIKETPSLSFDQSDEILSRLMPMVTAPSHEEVLNFYLKNSTDPDSQTLLSAISNLYSDYVFMCPTLFVAENLDNAHMYYNTHRSQKEFKADWMGMSHFFDVPYVFGVPLVDTQNYSEEDKSFSEEIINRWVSFARNGNLLQSGSTESWPKFKASEPTVHELNPKEEKNILFPSSEACEFWRPFFVSASAQGTPPPRSRSIKM